MATDEKKRPILNKRLHSAQARRQNISEKQHGALIDHVASTGNRFLWPIFVVADAVLDFTALYAARRVDLLDPHFDRLIQSRADRRGWPCERDDLSHNPWLIRLRIDARKRQQNCGCGYRCLKPSLLHDSLLVMGPFARRSVRLLVDTLALFWSNYRMIRLSANGARPLIALDPALCALHRARAQFHGRPGFRSLP